MPVVSTESWLKLNDERELIESIRSPDAELSAQAQLVYVSAYTRRLYPILRRYALSDAYAEDLCQQVWERALPSLRDGRYTAMPNKNSLPWLIGIGLNLAKQARRAWLREANRCTTYVQQSELAPHANQNPEEALARSEQTERLRWAIGQLPPGQREAVTRLYITGIHDAALRKRLSSNACKGLQRLKLILESQELNDAAHSG